MAKNSPKNTMRSATICIEKEKIKDKKSTKHKKTPEITCGSEGVFFDTHKNISH
jgi:hypothetical protein